MAITTINTDITITVIKQSINGAWLITDGIKQAWTRPSSRREDGTWTPSAYKALQLSEDRYITPEEQAKIDEERKQAYFKERQEEHERKQQPVYIIVNSNCEITELDKCYKISTGYKIQSPYKHRRCLIDEYVYIPKSQVKLITYPHKSVFEIPTWLYENNCSKYYRIGKIDN